MKPDIDPLGIELGRRAAKRTRAHMLGLDTAIDGWPLMLDAVRPEYQPEYIRGYRDGRVQLASYRHRRVYVNAARD